MLQLLKFLMLIFSAFLEQRRRAEVQQKKYELTEVEFLNLSVMAVNRMRSTVPLESKQARDVEDLVDNERKYPDLDKSVEDGKFPIKNR